MLNIVFDFQNIALLVTSVINIFLVGILYFYGKGKPVNKMYATNILFCVIWAISMILYRSANAIDSIFYVTLLYISPTLIASTFLHFTYIFPEAETNTRVKKFFIYAGTVIMTFLVMMPNMIISNVELVPYQEKIIHFGSGYFLYALYIMFYFSFAFLRLFKKSLKAFGIEKSRILYLLSGYSLAANFAFVTNLILPWLGIFTFNWVGQVFNIFMVAFTTFSIVKHRLMDIKVVLRKYSVYLLSLFSVIALAGLLQYGYRAILHISNFYIDIIITGLAVSIFPVLRSYYYHFANTYLFTSLYDTKQVISKLSEKLRSTLETEEIYQTLSETIQNALHIRSIVLLTYDHEKEEYSVADCGKDQVCDPIAQKLNKKFVDYLLANDRPLLTAEIDDRFSATKRVLSVSTEVVVPLNLKGKHIGLMLIGHKEASDSFDNEDMSLLKIVGSQTAIALENALLYGEAQHFNEVLKQRITRATKQLRSQNEKLKELDEMKTEFISIASHQLRTPLTATKWALDFLLKGADGKINTKQRESLTELSLMNVRLITLVNELLNISRIDEGRVKVEPKPTNVAHVVKEILAEFMPIIRKKNIILQEHYDTVPLIKLDAEVIGKALSNILSNGIKYNRDGKHLWVEVRKHKDGVAIIVKDEGIGIPAKEQDHLFQKFYRASNAMTSNTEGTGFGLYIAKSAIELSGGSISFESKEGVGTTFTVIVPLTGSRARKGEKSLA